MLFLFNEIKSSNVCQIKTSVTNNNIQIEVVALLVFFIVFATKKAQNLNFKNSNRVVKIANQNFVGRDFAATDSEARLVSFSIAFKCKLHFSVKRNSARLL